MYYSQQGEDKYLHKNYFNYENGFFIELGAMDGVQFSNTLFFENNLNWNGILIEPTSQYNQLICNRPKCYNFNYAVSDIEGQTEFLGDGALGGIMDKMSSWHRKGWKLDYNYKPNIVKTKPISKIIKNIKIELVDFFSIDVEGGELEVLKTFDWKIPVYLILIEGCYTADENTKKNWTTIPNINGITVNQNYIDRINECENILLQNDFVFVEKLKDNEIWINKKNLRV